MRFINPSLSLSLPLAFLILLPFLLASASIHDLLRSQGLPPGLLPREVTSYSLSPDGLLEIFLDAPCLTKFENPVYYDAVVKANLTYASLTGVVGFSQEELFLWLPVKDIIVSDPSSGLILFDIGVAHKQLSLSLFEDPPHCRSPPPRLLVNHVTKGGKESVFEAMR
ncbi:hypothetical protein MLD38_002267 [Melastoma candidum]|uniref:Uncharacterized protein n=1 Tax=Melastoma candidum TaxID=119954 RepID=A0ACB9SF96_9MYRT|nr:hypothetical protein MLD38_002267 [Melastoma candidum]